MCFYIILQVIESISCIKGDSHKERITETAGKMPYLTLKTSDLKDISRNRKCKSLSYGCVAANLRSIRGSSEELWPFSHQCAD